MKRRDFLSFIGGVAGLWPIAAKAQQPSKIVRIGRLSPLSTAAEGAMLAGLRQGLNDLGWFEGRNVAFEVRYAGGNFDRLPQLATELVAANVDVIVAGSTPGALAAKRATSKIPIVMVTTGDPVQDGLVTSLARPAGNVTGVTALGQALNAKRIELLKEALPGIKRVAVLTNPSSPSTESFRLQSEAIARVLSLEVSIHGAREPNDIEPAIQKATGSQAQGLMVLSDIMFITHRQRIVDLAIKNRLPSIYGERGSVQAGGLMFYGASLPDMYRRAAYHVDKILKGAKPADLPVEQPTKFELAVNLKAAKSLGLILPQSLLARADEIIE